MKHGTHCLSAALLCTLSLGLNRLLAATLDASGEHGTSQDSPQQDSRSPQEPRRVFKDQVTPHWFANDTRFWYRNELRGGAKEFVVVDVERGTREAAFDHAKLADSLSKAAGSQYSAEKLPFD